jgi:hypothetical protein
MARANVREFAGVGKVLDDVHSARSELSFR